MPGVCALSAPVPRDKMKGARKVILVAVVLLSIFIISCRADRSSVRAAVDMIAESYVKLALRVGLYDPNYIDAYFGPAEWKPSDAAMQKGSAFPYDQLHAEASNLLTQLKRIDSSSFDESEKVRVTYLEKLLLALDTKIGLLSGKKMTFDEESKALYDAVAPHHEKDYFEGILKELDAALPGQGVISARYNAFRNEFIIPKEKLSAVFRAALGECRRRTMEFIKLPPQESVEVEYVTGQPWGAYNWYKGNFRSLIQINTDLPIYIDEAISISAHEGYPGHHVYNSLVEMKLYREKNWVEFSVDPLFSPESLIMEGLANYGIEVIFPGNERTAFEKDVLFPLAGLDPAKAEEYRRIQKITRRLDSASTDALRRYIDGIDNREATINWLIRYSLMTPELAEKMLKFADVYGSYTINYTVGEEIIKNYIEKHGGTADNQVRRQELFAELLSSPLTASSLE